MDGGSRALSPLALTVNGAPVALMLEPRTHLADALREALNLTGTHLGCEQGVCGACTVLLDGVPVRACLTPAADCDGQHVTTIEGFEGDATMAALREAFSAHHALQCGFCTPGMLVTSRDIVLRLGDAADEARIREELSGNLCRCTGYVGIVGAVREVAAGRAPGNSAAPVAVAARAIAAAPTATPALPPSAAPAQPGGPSLEERLVIAADPATVWAALSDLRGVAACLPGAEVTEAADGRISGRMRVALGPIQASFAGEGTYALDDAARKGVLEGGGKDAGTGSAATGRVAWRVLPHKAGSEVVVTLSWRLAGALAQFSRPAVVAALVRGLAGQFARKLEARLTGAAPPAETKPLGLLALLWLAIKARLFPAREGGSR